MKLDFTPRLQRIGIDYNEPINGGRSAIANNGLSLSTLTPGEIVLGQNVGQAGNPAQLLSIREIPFNTFGLKFSGIGANASANINFAYFANSGLVPQLLFTNLAGSEIGRIR